MQHGRVGYRYSSTRLACSCDVRTASAPTQRPAAKRGRLDERAWANVRVPARIVCGKAHRQASIPPALRPEGACMGRSFCFLGRYFVHTGTSYDMYSCNRFRNRVLEPSTVYFEVVQNSFGVPEAFRKSQCFQQRNRVDRTTLKRSKLMYRYMYCEHVEGARIGPSVLRSVTQIGIPQRNCSTMTSTRGPS